MVAGACNTAEGYAKGIAVRACVVFDGFCVILITMYDSVLAPHVERQL